ncbi:MFS transporter permease [Paramagnetospirillum marisnigri]|uniref:MFS transporter permease n=1 Tax=Paramagnetospirillum marisnigri TaxID=1285242 RepID=A0A178MT56_9PROT|nr:MFS transporter [Paramagnetospirillum marisnigri]OAN52856.1 MFS transporter permease [Paramagnetospirillum marisnigri]
MDPSRTSWPAVFLAVGAGIVAAFQVGKAPIALPFIRDEMGLSLSAASWILSIFALMGASAGASMGSIVTRLGARRMLPLGLALLAAASLLGSGAPSLMPLLASRVAEGLGYMLVAISAPALIALLTHPDQRQTAFGLWGCFMPVGMAVAMTAAPALPLVGWRGLWLAMAVLLAAYAVLVHLRMPHPPVPVRDEDDQHLLRDIIATVKAPGPLILAATFLPYSAAYAALTGFLPTLLIERMAVSPGTAGLMAAAVTAANIVGNLATGPALRARLPRRWVMAASSLVIALCSLGIFLPITTPEQSYALCLVFSAVGGLLPGCILGGAAVYAPNRHLVPVALGLIMQGSNLGQLLGPVVVGAAVAAWTWPAAAAVLVPASLIGITLALALRRAGKEP